VEVSSCDGKLIYSKQTTLQALTIPAVAPIIRFISTYQNSVLKVKSSGNYNFPLFVISGMLIISAILFLTIDASKPISED